MPRTTPSLFLLVLLAGCQGSPSQPGGSDATEQAADEIVAPWWPVGSWWDLEITREGSPSQRARVVHFWNDSASHHFWLGVADRAMAMDHALHDTNPLLGRIHWELLTPHEKGIHAHGMYTFPVAPGDMFGGLMFGREWSIAAEPGPRPGALTFKGQSTDGATILYDYDGATEWFTNIEIRNPAGTVAMRVEVNGHGLDAHGTYYFLRGRDYYRGPHGNGTHDEPFEVEQEDPALKSLAIELDGTVSGPLRLEFVAPNGEVKHTETLVTGSIDRILEIPNPPAGEWTIKYVGTGNFQGVINGIGIVEFARAI